MQFSNSQADFTNLKQLSQEIFSQLDISTTTTKDYQYRIKSFLHFIESHGFKNNTYLAFKKELADLPNISVATKNKYLISAKVFLKELFRQGLIPIDITSNIKGFNQSRKHKKQGLNDREVLKVIEYCNSLVRTPQNMRLKAIVALLTLQGLRQIEVIRLNVKDLDFAQMVAFVRGKGQDDREPIYLHPRTVRILKQYLKECKVKDGALFRSRSNNSRNARLTTKSIRCIVKSMFEVLNIDRSTHGFRHYFTTKLVKHYKGDLLMVSQYTRHKSLEMLQVYNDAIIQQEDLPNFYEAFNEIRL
ncbi:MAG: site-specific integrase [Bacteroidetes bacterium]|nr:site-specific integrase [Bacteroidota bacterium]